uniref:Uncharacterized protein LOC111107615 n=1 Tax=Crassostrea virginica TaxID=6565 RepID=A0A8B8B664_CRAVI|nr:uncharacterized protein LOC111107615 [Crassostrea virginica]
MPKIKKSKRIAERRAGLQESHQEAHVNEQHPKEHPVSSNRDGVLDKSPGQTPEVAVLNSEAEFHVWVVGSSIVKRAFVAARNRPGGVCLGLQRECVTSSMRAQFTNKITKIQGLPGARPLGPHQGVAVDPLGALRRPQDPMPLKKKIHPPN